VGKWMSYSGGPCVWYSGSTSVVECPVSCSVFHNGIQFLLVDCGLLCPGWLARWQSIPGACGIIVHLVLFSLCIGI